ncbi:sulfite reductase [NADPH] flavoprotein alpha-component [Leptospira kobayashii]|uniref:Sulfite reductase [NADPH] flavoprotein alpha-component n=2 Tax=Leptospira kobayashii TaxID=1917830 RepID=A0ABM7UHQ1_9LEPT|nr:sulfite reductase [NADPH] flavoprotein alpha-component [Leptospira kobayashii]
MLSDDKRAKFLQLLKETTKDEWVWMNGYLSALTETLGALPPTTTRVVGSAGEDTNTSFLPAEVESVKPAPISCMVVYGTETGNSKKLSTEFVKKLKAAGHSAKVKSTEQYKLSDLDDESYFFVIIATHGDGDPPAAAKSFVTGLQERKNPLSNLKFAILALGDTSYPLFCKTGEDVDSMLNALGGTRIHELGKCDVDYEAVALPWIDDVVRKLAISSSNTVAAKTTANQKAAKPAGRAVYDAKVITNLVLNDVGATKSTRHIELKADSSVAYEPGDSAGFFAHNSESEVADVLKLLGLGKEDRIQWQGETWMAGDLLTKKLSIRFLPERVIKKYEELTGKTVVPGRKDLDALLTDFKFDSGFDSKKIFEILEPMVPRYYSIASSPAAHGEKEVHLTVAELEIETRTGTKPGLCSGYLSSFAEGSSIQFFIQKNPSFRLPPPDSDLIMIGPGTGIAPFRSYLFERESAGGSGKNWLFFGERNFVSDFYYQTELQAFMDTGLLNRLNTAFSRDTKQKVYVQDRMEENATELLKWIEAGAYIYLCGSKDPMSKDVDAKLIDILSRRTFRTEIDASDFLKELEESGRYKKDVY